MEDRHKLAIQTNYVVLIDHCDVKSLIPALLQSQVFSVQMIDKYTYGTDREVKRKLFLDIQKRGPEAFVKLVAALRQTSQNYLANLLDPIVTTTAMQPKKSGKVFMLSVDDEAGGDHSREIHNIAQNMPWDACINVTSVPNNINVIPGTQFFDQDNCAVPTYSTHSNNRGAVLIINIIKYNSTRNKERQGAEVDSRNLNELFLQLGFQVEMYTNLTGEQIREVVRNFKSSPLLNSVDMVFVIIMAHGNQFEGYTNIVGVDDDMVETDWIERQFDNANCKTLQSKPKIIMYQTCRGDSPDYGVLQKVEVDSAVSYRELPARTRTLNDILVAHSTIPGFASHRDTMLGTWYISNFCETVMNHAHNMHIEDIFKIVDSKLATRESAHRSVQTSMYSNLGFKKCYLHPMIYLENGIVKRIDGNG